MYVHKGATASYKYQIFLCIMFSAKLEITLKSGPSRDSSLKYVFAQCVHASSFTTHSRVAAEITSMSTVSWLVIPMCVSLNSSSASHSMTATNLPRALAIHCG